MNSKSYRQLRRELPNEFFRPYRLRLLTMASLFAVAFSSIYVIVNHDLTWYYSLLLAIAIGHCWGVLGLVGHEVLHGSVVRSKKWQNILGLFCFLPFLISPTFWRFWHNKLHHSHTQQLIADPDAFPTLRIFKHSRFMNWMYPFTPGSGHKRSYLYFFFWFSFNVLVAQFYFRFRNKVFNQLDDKKVKTELLAQALVHVAILYWVGPGNIVWVYAIPFLIQNYIPFSYISTNHNLSPLTKENDPLVNSLTVTNHPWLEKLHINFGYHVEHHLFPTINHVHHKFIHQKLKEYFPEKFQVMPKWEALKQLYKTARIYKNYTTLINPLTGETYPTLAGATPSSVAQNIPRKSQPIPQRDQPRDLH